jgi:hypothetical protein
MHRLTPKRFSRTWFDLLARVLVCLTVAVLVCSGENVDQISVRVLDAVTGKPIVDVPLLLGVPIGNEDANKLRDRTDSKGTARFYLNNPIPDRIRLIFGLEIDLCPNVAFSTDQVLKTGVIASNTCRGPRFEYSGSPEPGELVVFARRISLWERVKREL